MSVNSSDRREQVIDEAASWFVQMQRQDISPEELQGFADWLASSAEHVREYLQVSLITTDIANLPTDATKAALIETGLNAQETNVIPMVSRGIRKYEESDKGKVRNGWRRSLSMLSRAAIVVAVVSIAVTRPWPSSSGKVFETAVGEQRSFPLEDGTVMTLNTQSKVVLSFTSGFRDVSLQEGEVLFDVASDAERPFRVTTGKAMISAVGTEFNVRSRGDATVVTVVEGAIAVSTKSSNTAKSQSRSAAADDSHASLDPVLVTVGQQARVEGASGEVAVTETSIAEATAWRERRLIFESKPLSSVVEEFNLYNGSTIVIGDSALSSIEVSGAFNANDRQSFILFLEDAGLTDATVHADGTITLLLPETKHR